MSTWNSRGLRGSTLEDMVNKTNEKYREAGLALIQKVPTPITPVRIDQQSRHITLAYFDQKSTVDYIGAVQGIPICFDAKECAKAVRDFAFENTDYDSLYSYMKYDNIPSINTALSYGCSFLEEYEDEVNEKTRVYAISREEWKKIK